jgi:hypothetical protein
MFNTDIYNKLIRKIVRADKHISDLQIECDRFKESRPYIIDINRDSQTGETVYYLRCIEPIPCDIALIAGDVLNNLRSALDHVMWHFASQHAPVPNEKSVYFPILGSAVSYDLLLRGEKIAYLRQNIIGVLDTIKPYKGGNDLLWKLHKLNNLDKHRLLIPVAHTYTGRTETAAELDVSRDRWTRERPNEIFIAADISRVVPVATGGQLLNVGDEILRIKSELDEQPKLVIEIALAEVGVAEGEPLIPTLREIGRAVRFAIHQIVEVL